MNTSRINLVLVCVVIRDLYEAVYLICQSFVGKLTLRLLVELSLFVFNLKHFCLIASVLRSLLAKYTWAIHVMERILRYLQGHEYIRLATRKCEFIADHFV